MGHALPLLERIAEPLDIAVVNFGAWHGGGEGAEFAKLMREFADAVSEKAAVLPHLVWKEMVPTHYDQQHGLYPGRPQHSRHPDRNHSCALSYSPLLGRRMLRSILHAKAAILWGICSADDFQELHQTLNFWSWH